MITIEDTSNDVVTMLALAPLLNMERKSPKDQAIDVTSQEEQITFQIEWADGDGTKGEI